MYRRKYAFCCFCLVLSTVWASLLEFLPLSLSAADEIMPIADPGETVEELTIEETAALLVGSEVTYNIEWYESETVHCPFPTSGTVKPVLRYLKNENYAKNMAVLYLPIPGLNEYVFTKLSLVFILPFEVKACDTVSFAFAPVSLVSSGRPLPNFYTSHVFTYQIDDSQGVVDIFSVSKPYSNSYEVSLTNSLNVFFNYGSNCFLYLDKGSNFVLSNVLSSLNGLTKDITKFGFTYSPTLTSSSVSANFFGLGFLFAPMKFTYEEGGGYIPGGSGGGGEEGGGEEEPGGGSGGGNSPDYSEQLDALYKALVESGQIQMEQNQEIIQGQEDIKQGLQDILDAQKEQMEQDRQLAEEQQQHDQQLWDDTFDPSEEDQQAVQDDFNANADDLKEKLGFFDFLDKFLQGFVDIFDVDVGDGFPTLDIPAIGFDMPDGSRVTIWEDFTVDLADYLTPFKTVLSAIKFFTSLIFIGAFLNYCYDWLHGLLNSWQNDDIVMVDQSTGEVL